MYLTSDIFNFLRDAIMKYLKQAFRFIFFFFGCSGPLANLNIPLTPPLSLGKDCGSTNKYVILGYVFSRLRFLQGTISPATSLCTPSSVNSEQSCQFCIGDHLRCTGACLFCKRGCWFRFKLLCFIFWLVSKISCLFCIY